MVEIKTKIMRRVYLIWFVRKILPYVALETTGFVAFLYILGRQVYVARVIEYVSSVLDNNMAHPLYFASFVIHLFLRTHIGVQLSILGAIAMVFLLFRNVIDSAIQLSLLRETKPKTFSF